MSHILASINDSQSGRQMSIVYTPTDRAAVHDQWNETDALLHELQELAPFKGRYIWRDLSPDHIKFLLTRSIEQVFDLLTISTEDELTLPSLNENAIVSSMNFLIIGYCHAFETVTGSIVENIRLIRHARNEITISVLSFVGASFDGLRETPNKRSLRIVTKDED